MKIFLKILALLFLIVGVSSLIIGIKDMAFALNAPVSAGLGAWAALAEGTILSFLGLIFLLASGIVFRQLRMRNKINTQS
jgi:hypothetical protein